MPSATAVGSPPTEAATTGGIRYGGTPISRSKGMDDAPATTRPGSTALAAVLLAAPVQAQDVGEIVGGIARAATQHHRLCVGTLDRMTTDTAGLLTAGLDLAGSCVRLLLLQRFGPIGHRIVFGFVIS